MSLMRWFEIYLKCLPVLVIAGRVLPFSISAVCLPSRVKVLRRSWRRSWSGIWHEGQKKRLMQLFQPLYCVLLKHESIQRGFSQPPPHRHELGGLRNVLWSETQDESTPGDLPSAPKFSTSRRPDQPVIGRSQFGTVNPCRGAS